jgi:hypothetical protein
MRIKSAFLLLFLVVFSGCGKRQTTQIPDVTKPATLTLTPAPGQGALVHSISVCIRGKIDGSADFFGTELGTNHVGTDFEIRQSCDYYATNYVIRYVPNGVSAGKVTIEYEFRCAN